MPYSTNYNHIRMMFWDGTETDKTSKTVVYSFNKEGIEHALFRALKDYTSRTEKKQEGEAIASPADMLSKLIKSSFTEEIERYFTDKPKNQTEYDKWHAEMCKNFISIITGSKIRNSVSYGKAQKIVNMTMKTIYCLNGAEKYADEGYFDHCHMPLDSFIMDWFWDNVVCGYLNIKKKTFFKYNMISWSKLDNAAQIDKYGHTVIPYSDYVAHIRDYFTRTSHQYSGLTPFQAEFYIWPEIQWQNAAQNLATQDLLNKLLANPGITTNNPHITELCADLVTHLTDMTKYY